MTDLIDLEARLRAGLDAEASGAPAVGGLAAAARRRHRVRRGKRVWTASLALVVVVPLAFAALVRATTHVTDDRTGQEPAAERSVTWNGVSVTVPADWADGLPSRWCGDESVSIETSAPVVVTPDTPEPPVDYSCNPGFGYGVEVGRGADLVPYVLGAMRQGGSGPEMSAREVAAAGAWQYVPRDPDRASFPTGAWVRFVVAGGVGVVVVSDDPALTRRVAETVQAEAPRTSGWRTATWAGGRVDVPGSWLDGPVSAWCVEADSAAAVGPRVQLPGVSDPYVACSPASGYGVTVARGRPHSIATPGGPAVQYVEPTHRHPLPPYPDRSWVAAARIGDWSVVVVAADRRTAASVAASARVAPAR